MPGAAPGAATTATAVSGGAVDSSARAFQYAQTGSLRASSLIALTALRTSCQFGRELARKAARTFQASMSSVRSVSLVTRA